MARPIADLEALAGTLGSLTSGLFLSGKLRRSACKLLNGMHDTLLEEVLAEDGRQLVHEDLCQLQGLSRCGAVLVGQQAGNEAGDGQVSQLLT